MLREKRKEFLGFKARDSSWGELPLVLCPHLILGSVAMEAGRRERQTRRRRQHHHHVSDGTEMETGMFREEVVDGRIRRREDAD